MAPLYDVFLSHSTADKPAVEKLAHKLRELGIKPFFDKWELIPGEPSQEALEKALDESRTCAVFLGTGVLGPWQTEEMRCALDEWVGNKAFRVIPVLLPGAPDPKERKMPRFLRRPTWVSFRAGLDDQEAFHALVSGIQGKPPGSGDPEAEEEFARSLAGSPSYRCMAQPPEEFIHRSEHEKVLEALCPRSSIDPASPSAGITTALRGAGGFGKTSLAQAICFDENVRRQYPDGILWTTMGDQLDPEGRLSRVLDLIRWWTDTEPPGFKDLQAAGAKLREILKGRRVLLVVDDVWSLADLAPFQGLGDGAAILVTTRDSQTLPASSVRIEVDALASREAVSLLQSELPAGQENDFASLAARLGEWPLLLKLVNRQLREMVEEDGLALADALAEIWQALEAEGFSAFNRDDPEDRHAAADLALGVSLARLSSAEQERFLRLAVFPEDADVPLAVLEGFWGSGRFETQRLCRRLHDLSLLLRFDRKEGTVRLHDVFRQILIQRRKAELPALHQELLETLKPASGAWADLPVQESYLWRRLADHLRGAGRDSELRGLLIDFPFLAAKLGATDVNSLIADYEALAGDPELRRIQGALRLSAHVLARHPEELAPQLLGRLLDREDRETQLLLDGARSWRGGLWLRPRTASLIRPGGPLIRSLEGHSERVTAVAVVDGRRILSASADRTLRLWDLGTGETLRTFEGHEGGVEGVAVVDGRRAVSSSEDGTLRLWDLETGETLRSLKGHAGSVNAVTVVEGRRAVSASEDETLRVWDLETGETLHTLEGHGSGVTAVAVVDGRRAVSASNDGFLAVWDLETGESLHVLEGHEAGIGAVAVDGKLAVSASADGTLRVWDLDTGQALQVLGDERWRWFQAVALVDRRWVVSGSDDGEVQVWDLETGQPAGTLGRHAHWLAALAVTRDRRVVSASWDQTLRVWDLDTGATLCDFDGHKARVAALAAVDARRAVSASTDRTLRVWDLESGRSLRTLEGHTAAVNGVAMAGGRAVSGSNDATLREWDLETGRNRQTLQSYGGRAGVGWVAAVDGRRILTASALRSMELWDVETGETLRSFAGHSGDVGVVAALDGRCAVSGSSDRALRVWELDTGELLRVMEGHSGGINALAVLDGRRIVSGSEDRTLRVWDVETGETLRSLEGHSGAVLSVAVVDGRTAVSAAKDRTLRMWDLETGDELALLNLDAPVTAVLVSLDGQIVMAADQAGRVHFFDWMNPGRGYGLAGSPRPVTR
ncbi:MAG TPA: TIR domain-containing protein [Thermoanaerobaculia bacterium]|nr:TIR domain-containing protein [Thermoanaerobaculia bacterium]